MAAPAPINIVFMMHKFKYNCLLFCKKTLFTCTTLILDWTSFENMPQKGKFWKDIKRKGKRPPPFFPTAFVLSLLPLKPTIGLSQPPCLAHYPPQWVLQIPPLEIGKEKLKRKNHPLFPQFFFHCLIHCPKCHQIPLFSVKMGNQGKSCTPFPSLANA